MSGELVAKIPFKSADGEDFDVWVVRVPTDWEFRVFVRQDDKPVAFVCGEEPPARMTYTVSFETEIDARMVMNCSAVTQAVSTAKADVNRLPHIVVSGG